MVLTVESFLFRQALPDELEEHQRFRAEIFAPALPPHAIHEQRDDDGLDEYSDLFFALSGGEIAGCVRLTYDNPKGSYAKQFFQMPNLGYPWSKIGEISRLGIGQAYHELHKTRLIRQGLLLCLAQRAHEQGLRIVTTGMHSRFYRLITRQEPDNPYRQIEATPKDVSGSYYEGYINNDDPIILLQVEVGIFLAYLKQMLSIS